MEKVKCPFCDSEITFDMIMAKMCFVCGETLENISIDEEIYALMEKEYKEEVEKREPRIKAAEKRTIEKREAQKREFEAQREAQREAQKKEFEAQRIEELRKQNRFDYLLHGTNPLFEIKGNRGRYLYVYEHKCVIKVGVTLGSIVTSNATDGEKTIYYKDIIGVQLKKEGLLIGYLQLETASEKGNNKTDNFFDENTFTFDNYVDVHEAYRYIISRLDEIKRI